MKVNNESEPRTIGNTLHFERHTHSTSMINLVLLYSGGKATSHLAKTLFKYPQIDISHHKKVMVISPFVADDLENPEKSQTYNLTVYRTEMYRIYPSTF